MIQTDKSALYTGITTDLQRRFAEHQEVFAGKSKARGAKFFRGQKPEAIVYARAFANRSEASKFEYQLKRLSKIEKLNLVAQFQAVKHPIC